VFDQPVAPAVFAAGVGQTLSPASPPAFSRRQPGAARPPDKEKPHRTGPQTFGTQSDAARPGLGWDPASGYLIET
jgi:hypothetical protein